MSRENFNVVVNAEEYGLEPTETPRTDKLVKLSGFHTHKMGSRFKMSNRISVSLSKNFRFQGI